MMMSWHGNISRVTGLCERNLHVTGGFPSDKPAFLTFGVFFVDSLKSVSANSEVINDGDKNKIY